MAALKTYSGRVSADDAAERVPCPQCGSADGRRSWVTLGARFVRCPACGLRRQDPRPSPAAVEGRYRGDYLGYERARQDEYAELAALSLSEAGLRPGDSGAYSRAPRLLEVGSATGALLSRFAGAGWETLGVELSPELAAYARARYGLEVVDSDLGRADLGGRRFDVAVASHLVEHLPDPRGFLRLLSEALEPAGRLYLITPNAASFQAVLKRRDWRSAIPDHLVLFSVRTLRAMLASEGFIVEYSGTWGGWPAGMRPRFLKRPLDRLAKALGWGDVMAVRARKAP